MGSVRGGVVGGCTDWVAELYDSLYSVVVLWRQ